MSGLSIGAEFAPLAFFQVNISTTAGTLNSFAAIPTRAKHVMIYPEGGLRMRCDGTNPTGDVGIILDEDLHVFENQRTMMDNMILISDTGGIVAVNIHYFG